MIRIHLLVDKLFSRSSRIGQSLPSALIAMGLIGVSAAAVPKVIDYMNKRNQTVKVLNAMVAAEQRVRSAISRSDLYTGCALGNCQFNPPSEMEVGKTLRSILGADCLLAAPGCGVRVDKLQVNGNMIEAKLSYEGKDVVVKPIEFAARIPQHSSAIVECLHTEPIFLGLDEDGAPRCAPLDKCGPGQFVRSYDPKTLKVSCTSIPNGIVKCDGDQYISAVVFGPDLKPSLTCSSRRID